MADDVADEDNDDDDDAEEDEGESEVDGEADSMCEDMRRLEQSVLAADVDKIVVDMERPPGSKLCDGSALVVMCVFRAGDNAVAAGANGALSMLNTEYFRRTVDGGCELFDIIESVNDGGRMIAAAALGAAAVPVVGRCILPLATGGLCDIKSLKTTTSYCCMFVRSTDKKVKKVFQLI